MTRASIISIPEIVTKYKVIERNLEIIESVYPSNGRNGGRNGGNRGNRGNRGGGSSRNSGGNANLDKKP